MPQVDPLAAAHKKAALDEQDHADRASKEIEVMRKLIQHAAGIASAGTPSSVRADCRPACAYVVDRREIIRRRRIRRTVRCRRRPRPSGWPPKAQPRLSIMDVQGGVGGGGGGGRGGRGGVGLPRMQVPLDAARVALVKTHSTRTWHGSGLKTRMERRRIDGFRQRMNG